MKKILGLDLGTNSIGWAHVIEGETPETSEIKQIGVRVIQFDNFVSTETGKESKEPIKDFCGGKGISNNAGRTLKRSARRSLQRFKLRRDNLKDALINAGIINSDTILAEDGKNTTYETWEIRAKSASQRVELNELARVFFAINKKRGYKSSRKAKSGDDGKSIDGMAIAMKLYEENLTPGEFVFNNLILGKKFIPDFYRSDLKSEFDRVWNFQKQFYPDILNEKFYTEIEGKGQKATSALFYKTHGFNTAEIKNIDDDLKNVQTIKLHARDLKKLQGYKWRTKAIREKLSKEEVAYVLTDINNNLNNSSGYLGAISDRSKELYFNKETIGQNLYRQLQHNRHKSLKRQVFYRQDYLDEFETIWNTQASFHSQLTEQLKIEIRDIVIFYQRKLKSQKSLVSICELEGNEILINGKTKLIGPRVAPKSSPIFQEFKIWQNLNNVLLKKAGSKKRTVKILANENDEIFNLSSEDKNKLFDELNIKGTLKAAAILSLLERKSTDWEINYTALEGNRTNASLYNAYLKILDLEGYNEELLKLSDKDDIDVSELKTPAIEIKQMVKSIFEAIGIRSEILEFNAELEGKDFETQPSYQLWHLLYSSEDDTKKYSDEDKLIYGNDNIGLKKQICTKFGFKPEHAKIISNITFQDDYGSLSTKAIRKIFPYIKESKYSDACELAGYRHSKNSLTTHELQNRQLKTSLDLVKKNSLRNPVVEKILNQMVNVVNELIVKNSKKDNAGKITHYYQFDEIRIELARELKKNADERAEMTSNINAAKITHEKIYKQLQTEFGLSNPTRNDIVKYKLYEELKNNGYKDLYTDTYIPREILFSKEIDIEHIIPQSRLYDDSFSNKTVVYRKDNLAKGNLTAIDYIDSKFGEEGLKNYLSRIEFLYEIGRKSKEDGISKAKYQKLLKRESEIGDGFIERDLRESQYIAKKAKEMLFGITRAVVSTSGSITDKLRNDWGLIDIMKELNLPKYRELGLTQMEQRKFGQQVEVIKDWTKRNDHRHHAMDALTVAFTKHNYIQYLNYLNARKNENHKLHGNIMAIEKKETDLIEDKNGNKKRIFKEPILNFRQLAKEHLENVLVSHKAKNKVVTKNKNKITGTPRPQVTLTPRGQLHKETVYGKYQFYVHKEEKISSKFDIDTINKVANPLYKKYLLERLEANNNDPSKAFAGKNALSKNPIYLNEDKSELLPEKVKLIWLESDYSIRKDVTPDNFKDEKLIDKVLDEKIKKILKARLKESGGDSKKAFADLDKNPIWLNKDKGISIKRVTISGVSNAEPLHYKKDHLGNLIVDKNGNNIPVDFVSTGSNHHVAIYKDDKGNLQENVISFYEAVERVNQGLPVIDKNYNSHLGWQFMFTLKQNEMFVFPNEKTGFNPNETDLTDPKNKKLISPNLYRVQTISVVKYGNYTIRDFKFRHHLETTLNDSKNLQGVLYQQLKSLAPLNLIVKVRTNHLGDIVCIGEY
jgi:CRISPR-associated endonuclease Csn1